ncbi:MAG: aminopeptidase P family protein [Chloroflexi bacterium]|nr:aminopeptidase P family protein [Chloroflexota bacterium]
MADKGKKVLANIERLKEQMDRNGCSAVAVRSGKNFTYLSGVTFRGTQARNIDLPDSPRETYLIWPRDGDPVVITNTTGEGSIRSDSWVERVEVSQTYAETGIVMAAKAIKDMGLDGSKIGFEKTYLSAARWEELEGLLPKTELFDCTEMMDIVRWVKTPGEVDLLKKAADIQDEAYLEVFPNVKVGETEREVHIRLIKACMDRGCEFVHGALISSRNKNRYNGEGDTPFLKGDIIRPDYVSYYHGYPGHQNRLAVMGTPSDEQKRIYQQYRDIYWMTIDRCKPGVKASDLWQFAREKLLEKGFPHNPGAMAGHSVGPWVHQQKPLIVSNDDTEMEEGMVIAFEPYFDYWHLQDMVVVTRDGTRLLSDRFNTEQLFVIG